MSLKILQNWLDPNRDADMGERYNRLNFVERVIENCIYDEALDFGFYQGHNETGEYIKLRARVPTVQTGLASVIVNDSTSLLFAESHFPAVICKDKKTQVLLGDLIEEYRLQETMLIASRMGSVGSVALEVVVLDGKLIVNPLEAKNLTPVWHPRDPRKLLSVVQRYKVLGKDLNQSGLYSKLKTFDSHASYWFHAEWDENNYTHYVPYTVTDAKDEEFKPTAFEDLTYTYNLGVVPIVWIKNLPSLKPSHIDGYPTVCASAISTIIEIDYQLSQGGRALTYSADPITVIKEGEDSVGEDGGSLIRTSDNVIRIDAQGDAKMLEIDGKASKAILEYCQELRERVMELVRGNRTSPDKLAAATSGYAIELMNMALTNLVKELRVSYGVGGLLELLNLIAKMSEKVSIKVGGKNISKVNVSKGLRLKWKTFYEETETDKQQKANTLSVLTQAGLLAIEQGREEAATIYNETSQDATDENTGKQGKTYVDPMPPKPGNDSAAGKTNTPKAVDTKK